MKIYQINNLEKKITKFYDLKMKEITDETLLNNFQKVALGFPKAILYAPPLKRKIYAIVEDSVGRTQYFYTKNYVEKKDVEKFKGFIKKFLLIKDILEECRREERDEKMNEIYNAVLLIYNCNFRVGNDKYKKLYDTNGAVTIRKENLRMLPEGIKISFIGKKKELNESVLRREDEPKLYDFLRKIYLRHRNEDIFKNINYENVYDFLRDKGTKPKDIRMISANEIFFKEMKNNKLKRNLKPSEVKKYLKEVLDRTSERMNHTSAVCRKKYLLPNWFDIDKINYGRVRRYNLEDYLKKQFRFKV